MNKKIAQPAEAELSARDTAILSDPNSANKASQLAHLTYFKPGPWASGFATIQKLRDETRIRRGWKTVRESRLPEMRLRARRCSIDGANLHSLDDGMRGA